MNPYILKSLLEIIVLLILYIVVLKKDERISIIEEKKVNTYCGKYVKVYPKEPSFKSKVVKETKRIKSVKK